MFVFTSVVDFYLARSVARRSTQVRIQDMRDKYDKLQFHAVNSTALRRCALRAIKVNFIYGKLLMAKCTAVVENASVSNEREFQKQQLHSK